jgi:glycosyltransferase involved in cell wall biosynthesis
LIKIFPNHKSIYTLWAKRIVSYSDALVVLSKEWLDIQGKVKNKQIFYLPNAINLSPYININRIEKELHESIEFIYLGHIGQEKGIFDLVDSSQLIKNLGIDNFKVKIYGEAISIGEVERIQMIVDSLDLGENILINHAIFGYDKLIAFHEADIFVLPSYHEGMPISIIEAMGAGFPVLASNVGGIPDLVDNGRTGLLVPPGNIEKLANALIRLISEPDLRREMGLAGRLKALMNNDIEKYAFDLFAVYNKVAFAQR